jgi:hypothetical protein
MNSTSRPIRPLFWAAIAACCSLALFLTAGPSQLLAGTLSANQYPTVTIKIEGANPGTWSNTPSADSYDRSTDPDGGYELEAPRGFSILGNRAQVVIDELQFDPDPFVLNNILVTNTTAATQIFSAFVGLPTTFAAPNLISGNVRTSVIDGGADGATIASVAGQALYQAQIDSATVASLQNDPFSVIAPAGGSNTASDTFGPNVSLIPVNSNIGILLRFSLSPGDTAAILSRFDVVAVPEPASAALMGMGFVLACLFGRRRIGQLRK